MKSFTLPLLTALLAFCVGVVAAMCQSSRRERVQSTEGWETYVNEGYGYRLRYPAGWKLRAWGGEVYLCSPRIRFPCGRTPHEVYATVHVTIRDSEGLSLQEYLRSPARGYKDLRKLRVGGVEALAAGPVEDDRGKFIDEQVYMLRGHRVYVIIAYAVDSRPEVFEQV